MTPAHKLPRVRPAFLEMSPMDTNLRTYDVTCCFYYRLLALTLAAAPTDLTALSPFRLGSLRPASQGELRGAA